MSTASSNAVEIARNYYNSDDADNFYYEVWGGEDIHIGLYRSADDSIAEASERTVAAMADELGLSGGAAKLADFGAGYGGSARWLARRFGCHVSCVNLSEVQNQRNRAITAEAALNSQIEVFDASFEHAPLADGAYDHVWSQDSLLHSSDRQQVMREVDRILRPGGTFIFTDPMQADDCPEGVLQPVLDRLHLESLGSPAFYRKTAAALGWEELSYQNLTAQLVAHYARVRHDLISRRSELADKISPAYVDRMIEGLANWVSAGSSGHLAWGILHFGKTES